MAAQGQSGFSSAGDAGAYDALYDQESTNLAVDNPSDSPWITAAGGTTLPGEQVYNSGAIDINIPSERTWGWDYFFPFWSQAGADNQADWVAENLAGGGGGISAGGRTPAYQQGVVSAHRLLQLHDDRLLFRQVRFRGATVFQAERHQRETHGQRDRASPHSQAHATLAAAVAPPPSIPGSRSRIKRSASLMIRSINSLTVGMSLISPATIPQLHAPASISPPSRTRG